MAEYHCTLAKKYNPDKHDVIGWGCSEKLDGVRAIWCPNRRGFFSRSNKPLNVPEQVLKESAPAPVGTGYVEYFYLLHNPLLELLL